jgi:hypothetical protein
VVGENFGGMFTGSGTDPNSGPLLALLAVTYWPVRANLTSARRGNPTLWLARTETIPQRRV